MAIPERHEIVRIDCNFCNGNGYRVLAGGGEEPCGTCGGVGMREKKMPWRPEGYDDNDKRAIFGVAHVTNRRDKDDPANVD